MIDRGQALLAVCGADAQAAGELGETRLALLVGVEGPLLRLRSLSGGTDALAPVDRLWGIAGLSVEGVAEARRLAESVNAETGVALPVTDLAAAPDAERLPALLQARVEALESALDAARRTSASLARGLAGLRREHEVLLERYMRLEQSVVGGGAQPLWPVCRIEPASDPVELGAATELGRSLSVLLPFNVSGLAELEIFVDQPGVTGVLHLALEGLEAGRTLAAWTRSGSELRQGWNSFNLAYALAEPPASAHLRVRYEGRGRVRLASGPLHPAPELQPVGETDASGEAPLALRATASVPGLRLARLGAATASLARLEDFTGAVQAGPDAVDFEALVGAAEEGGLLVQPLLGEVTQATLPDAVPAGTAVVDALVLVAHAEGPVIQFALASGPLDHLEVGALEHPQPGFSGWISAVPMTPTTVTLLLDQPTTAVTDLHVLTRLDPEATHDWFARATVRSVGFFQLASPADAVDED